ncbi:MAG: hypothetical protein WD016_13270 [Balneolaceae bacterium]
MLSIFFIGKLNQTNATISDSLSSGVECNITFIDPAEFNTIPAIKNFRSLAICDLSTIPGNPTDSVRTIREIIADIPLLAMHRYLDMRFIQPVMEAGANGYISSTPAEKDLIEAVQKIAAGQDYIGTDSAL